MARVVVVGGGVAGMAIARELLERGGPEGEPLDVTCYEAGQAPGGPVRTERRDGFILESGPVGLREADPDVPALIRRLCLGARRVVAAPAGSGLQVFRAGKSRPLPRGAGGLLLGDLLPPGARARVLAEPLVSPGTLERDESVEDFAVRRLGRRAGSFLADALATAVAAGDSRRVSMRSVFPRLRSMEADHGSLFRALRSPSPDADPDPDPSDRPLVTFADGLQELTRALIRDLGNRLQIGTAVCSASGMGERGFRVVPETGPPLDADALVLACPAADAGAIVEDWDPELAAELRGISAAPVARVHLGYRDGALTPWPGGSALVVPRDQGLRMLGSEWVSNTFPGHAPAGSHLVTVTFGGARDPGALELDDRALIDAARADLGRALGLVAAPYMTRVFRDGAGVPQREVGHAERMSRVAARLALQPGLHLGGCSYGALELGACLAEASRLARAVTATLAPRPLAAV